MTCECEDMPAGHPDPRDPMNEDTTRNPNPVCPRHADDDHEALGGPAGYDPQDVLETFGLAYSHEQGQWVEADGVDDETGEPYELTGERKQA